MGQTADRATDNDDLRVEKQHDVHRCHGKVPDHVAEERGRGLPAGGGGIAQRGNRRVGGLRCVVGAGGLGLLSNRTQ